MDEVFSKILIKLGHIDVALIGSYGLKIQGVEGLEPNDIDFLTDDENIEKIADIFGAQVRTNLQGGYKEIETSLDNIDVQFVSQNNNSLREGSFPKDRIFVEQSGKRIPCMSLVIQLGFYKNSNREKDRAKVLLIEKKLAGLEE